MKADFHVYHVCAFGGDITVFYPQTKKAKCFYQSFIRNKNWNVERFGGIDFGFRSAPFFALELVRHGYTIDDPMWQ